MSDDLFRKGADRAVAAGLRGWWDARSEKERVATALIAAGLAIGPLGQGLLGAASALYSNAMPGSKQLEAVWWLFILTGPLAVFCFVFAVTVSKHAAPAVAGGLAAVGAVLTSMVLTGAAVPSKLAGLYCYAAPGSYEHQCRVFDHAGFVADNASRANPTGAMEVFGSAVAYTVDARGSFMALSAIVVFGALGWLARENR